MEMYPINIITRSESDSNAIKTIEKKLKELQPKINRIHFFKITSPEAIRIQTIYHALSLRLEELKFSQTKNQPDG